jgi:hypothetical protein
MKHLRLDPEELAVASFEVSTAAQGFHATEPVEPATEPDTWEDTCIKMCPTDDTCTMLGCTR